MIKFLGENLAKKINKDVMPSTGFIRLALKDDHGMNKDLSIKDIKHTLESGLRKRLNAINIQEIDEIINFLNKKLLENQALLTMTKF